MQPINRITSRTVVIASSDIDTDQIIPARFLTTTTREGLGKQLFADWRYQSDGTPQPLQHALQGWSSRRIFGEHRLVYRVSGKGREQRLEIEDALKARAQSETEDERRGLFIVVVPQEGGHGHAARRARTRLKLVLDRLQAAGLFAAGMIGDPDPFTAITNALQYFRVDDIVISTFAATKSGWLRADLIQRVRNATGKEVQHVVHRDPARSAA